MEPKTQDERGPGPGLGQPQGVREGRAPDQRLQDRPGPGPAPHGAVFELGGCFGEHCGMAAMDIGIQVNLSPHPEPRWMVST